MSTRARPSKKRCRSRRSRNCRKSDQFRAILFASLAARGREDYLAAHEFMAIATGYPDAKAEHWVLRASMASWIDNWADAGLSITTVAKDWPAALPDIGDETIQWTALKMSRDKKLAADRLEMLNALFAAKFQLEWHIEPADLWRDLSLDALQRNDLARAREVLKRIDDPGSLVRMRIDRRFDAIVTGRTRNPSTCRPRRRPGSGGCAAKSTPTRGDLVPWCSTCTRCSPSARTRK